MPQLLAKNIHEHDDLINLILDIKKGNNESFNQLVYIYSPAIKSIASRFFLIGWEQDDLYQEGLIGLFKATQAFDPFKGGNFNALAKLCIKRSILQIVRSNNANKQMIHNNSYMLYDLIIEDKPMINMIAASDNYNPEKAFINNENYQKAHEIIDNTLTNFEKQVFQLFLCERAYSEISNQLGTSTKSIDNALTRVKKKLRKSLKIKLLTMCGE
jgi:RNA polymerase sporulation-specific sigma factor